MRQITVGLAMFVFACGAALGQSAGGKIAKQLSGSSDWSAWKLILLEKHDPLSDARWFVTDTRFEYRWRPEWAESGYACTVEIRPAEDADQSDRVPEFDVVYESQSQMYAAPDVPIGRKPSQVHFLATLNVLIGNKLRHANFNLTDCERVEADAAGHFSPDVAIPAF